MQHAFYSAKSQTMLSVSGITSNLVIGHAELNASIQKL